jgi:hypothetical protein
MSTAYHPQTDGQTERQNRTIEESLRAFVNTRHDDWDDHLAALEFVHNNSVNASTGHSPFYLNYGHHPATFLALTKPVTSVSPSAEQFIANLRDAHTAAIDAMRAAQAQQQAHANKHRRHVTFAVGDQVLLSTANLDLRLPGQSFKLMPRWSGPFPVTQVISDTAYKLQLPDEWLQHRMHDVFHVSLLRPYRANDPEVFPDREVIDRPPPVLVAPGDETFEVEAIVGKRTIKARNGRLVTQYEVKWKGYPTSDNTWEPEHSLKHNAGPGIWPMVQAYNAQHGRPRRR